MGAIGVGALAPANHMLNVTPAGADVVLSPAAVVRVDGAGDVKFELEGSGSAAALTLAFAAGEYIPGFVSKIYNTGTDATVLVAFF